LMRERATTARSAKQAALPPIGLRRSFAKKGDKRQAKRQEAIYIEQDIQ
jgi:hypothetical protein